MKKMAARAKDWRAWAVVFAVVLAYAIAVAVGIGLDRHLHDQQINVWISFYSSWVASLLFFTIVGIAALVYSAPLQPDTTAFDERVRMFYGNLAPRMLREYAREHLKKLCGYNQSAERELEVQRYDNQLDAYCVEARSLFMVRNFLPDVPYHDRARLNIFVDTFSRPPVPMGRMQWIYVDGRNVLGGGQDISASGFSEDVDFEIPPDSEIKYEYKYWVWHKVGEENNQRPKRVTVLSKTKIRNSMPSGIIPITLPDSGKVIEIAPGEEYIFSAVPDATPNDLIFRFVLGAPK